MSKLILVAGMRGTGKTLSVVKEAYLRHLKEKTKVYSNFPLNQIDHVLLKIDDFIKTVPQEGKKKDKYEVNWDFWKKVKEEHAESGQPYDLIWDEAHSFGLNSRRSMSGPNLCFSQWIAQSRKMLGEQKGNNMYFISQVLDKVDKDVRDLADEVWLISKVKTKTRTVHIVKTWRAVGGYSAFHIFMMKRNPDGSPCLNGNVPPKVFIGETIYDKDLYDTEWFGDFQ